jgi:hypothetical protein
MVKAAREAFQIAFEQLGGPKALTDWGRDNPTQFYTMYSKLIPQQIEASFAPADVSEAPLSEREWSALAQNAA